MTVPDDEREALREAALQRAVSGEYDKPLLHVGVDTVLDHLEQVGVQTARGRLINAQGTAQSLDEVAVYRIRKDAP